MSFLALPKKSYPLQSIATSRTTPPSIGTSVRRIKADRADTYDQQYLACRHRSHLEVEQTVYLGDGTPLNFPNHGTAMIWDFIVNN